jgi:antitoxin CptB
MATETAENTESRLKRMRMRSWRRGTKEMDLVLGPFADRELARLGEAELALYDRLLEENDHDLYAWITGRAAAPVALGELLARIARFANIGN